MAFVSGIQNMLGGLGMGSPAVSSSVSSTALGTSITNGGMGTQSWSSGFPGNLADYEEQHLIETIRKYCEYVGDTLEYIYVDKTITTNDPKVSMLKLAQNKEVVKNVGFKLNDKQYYVIREKE